MTTKIYENNNDNKNNPDILFTIESKLRDTKGQVFVCLIYNFLKLYKENLSSVKKKVEFE